MKKLLALLTAVFLLFSLTIAAFAVPDADPSERLYDYADLLSDSEEAAFREELLFLTECYGMDAAVVLTDDAEGLSSAAYADDFYDYNGFSYDGLLMLVNMDAREVWISTSGTAIQTFTDGVIDDMTYDIAAYLGEGDYAGAVDSFLDLCDYHLQRPAQGETISWEDRPILVEPYPAEPPTLGEELLEILPTALRIAVVAAAGAAAIMVYRHESLPSQRENSFHYISGGRIHWRHKQDFFLSSHVSKTKIPKDPPSSSSSSHSSVHTSSSGRSHGGGGRSF